MFYRVPFLRFTLSLVAGIIFFEYFLATRFDFKSVEPVAYWGGGFLLLLCCIVVGRGTKRLRILVFVGFFVAGVLSSLIQYLTFQSQVSSLKEVDYDTYVAEVTTLPEKRAKSFRFECLVTSVRKSGSTHWQKTNVKGLVNVPIGSSVVPNAGSIVLVNGKLEEPKRPGNPEEFDYKLFLNRKGIAWTDYWQDRSYQVLGVVEENWNPLHWSWWVSGWATLVLRKAIENDDSYGLIRAMILGRRDDLRGDLIDNYVASGTVHVLSVSGLHVGVFFTVISWLLGWLKRFRVGRYINFLALAALLFFYGFITGMPACVQRAIIMCLTWALANVLVRDQNGVNTLSFSAFIILLFDPYALMDVGFQLSYLAILGIILFYKPIESFLDFKTRIAKYSWQVSALSIAAQLTTFPLSSYYFHQFPSYFLLVNPLVMALTTLLLPVTMIFLLISCLPFPEVAWLAGRVLEGIAWLTNSCVTIPKLLPGYLIQDIYSNGYEVYVLFVLLLTVWATFYYRKLAGLWYVLVLTIGFSSYSTWSSFLTFRRRQVVVHSFQKDFVVSIKTGNRAFISSSDSSLKGSGNFDYKLRSYLISQGIARDEVFYLAKGDCIDGQGLKLKSRSDGLEILCGSKKLWIGDYGNLPNQTNYCIIHSSRYPPENDSGVIHSTVFLLSGAMSKNLRVRWMSFLKEKGLKFYDLDQNGALLISW